MSAPTATAPTGRRSEGRVRKPLLYVITSLGLLVMAAPLLWMASRLPSSPAQSAMSLVP